MQDLKLLNQALCAIVFFVSSMSQLIPLIQLGAAILLIFLVILQRSGGDIGGAFGGDGAQFSRTRRGFERTLFFATVVVAILFVVASAAMLLYK